MNAADGTPIAEDLLGDYQNALMRSERDIFQVRPRVIMEYVERVSRAEQRERVLREALDRVATDFETDFVLDDHVVDDPAMSHIAAWKVARAALATPTPAQTTCPECRKVAQLLPTGDSRSLCRQCIDSSFADSLTVQPLPGGVLVEDPTRNLSVLAVEQPLHITCPFDGEQWRFHTQVQADRFADHLRLAHAQPTADKEQP